MLTESRASVYMNRRRMVRKYIASIPESRFDLSDFVNGDERDLFVESSGKAEALKCNAVACLGGWIWTMPAYRNWCKRRHYDHVDEATYVAHYLGMETNGIFSPRRYWEVNGSDKKVALRRLDYAIEAGLRRWETNPGPIPMVKVQYL